MKTKFGAIALVMVLVLTACFSPWKGDEGTFTVSIGGLSQGGAGARFLDPETILRLEHTIIVSGGPGPDQIESFTGNKTVSFSVIPGQWDILVKANQPYGATADGILMAVGYAKGVNIKPGPNGAIEIEMERPVSFSFFAARITGQDTAYGAVAITQGSADNDPASIITVTATPNTGYNFVKWVTGDGFNDNTINANALTAGNYSDDNFHGENISFNTPASGPVSITFNITGDSTLYAVFDGNGTSTPKNIASAFELQDIGMNAAALAGNYRLMTNIKLSDTGADWDPIGNFSTSFSGSLDGNFYTINVDSAMDITPDISNGVYVGLFRRIDAVGRVENLRLTGNITVDSYASDSGVGAITANNNGTIKNVSSSVVITVNGDGSPQMGYAGGIAGMNNGTIKNCSVTGAVTGSFTSNNPVNGHVGGIAGNNWGGTIENCYATGTVTGSASAPASQSIAYVGGIAGWDDGGNVIFCWASGNIKAAIAGQQCAGGIAGAYLGSTISSCVALGESITAGPGASIDMLTGRITVPDCNAPPSTHILSDNYAGNNVRLSTDGGSTSSVPTTNIGHNEDNGANFTNSGQPAWTATQNSTPPGPEWTGRFGSNESAPWVYVNTSRGPRLWFENSWK